MIESVQVGPLMFFLWIFTILGILSRCLAFVLSKFKIRTLKRYIISDVVAMLAVLFVVFNEGGFIIFEFGRYKLWHHYNNYDSIQYFIGGLVWLVYDLKIKIWLKESNSTASKECQRLKNHLSKHLSLFDWVRVSAVVALILSLGFFSSGYRNSDYAEIFYILCYITFGVCAYSAYLAVRRKEFGWAWALAIVAFVFNPFQKRAGFQIQYNYFVNIVAGIIILASMSAFKGLRNRGKTEK